MGCRQVVKATDSDSVIVGSNPTAPANENKRLLSLFIFAGVVGVCPAHRLFHNLIWTWRSSRIQVFSSLICWLSSTTPNPRPSQHIFPTKPSQHFCSTKKFILILSTNLFYRINIKFKTLKSISYRFHKTYYKYCE